MSSFLTIMGRQIDKKGLNFLLLLKRGVLSWKPGKYDSEILGICSCLAKFPFHRYGAG